MKNNFYLKSSLLLQFLFIASFGFGQSLSKHYLKGNNLQDKNEFIASIKQYSKAINDDPSNREYYYRRARSYRKIGKYSEALSDIDKCLEIDKNFKEGHFEKGAMYAIGNNYSMAVKEFSFAIEMDSTFAKAYTGRGAAYHLLEQYDEALIDYKKSLQLDLTNGTAFYDVGLTLNEIGKYDEAIIYLNEALRLSDDDHQAFFERGRSLYEIKEFALAVINFRNAIIFNDKLDPWEKLDNGRSYYYKGLSNVRLNKMTQACSDFENSINYNYDEAEAEFKKFNCSQVLKESNDNEELKPLVDTSKSISIKIYPNPILTYAIISTLKNQKLLDLNLKIINMEGITIQSINNIGDSFVFNRRNILSGTYLFIITSKNEIISSQKIIIQ